MMEKNCLACGGMKFKPIYEREKWQVMACEDCGLGFLEPEPTCQEMALLYDQKYFDRHYPEDVTREKVLREQSHRLRFIRPYKKSGRILDVGCGKGYFLLACRTLGYEVEGLDISAEAAAFAGRHFQIPVQVSHAAPGVKPAASYDLVTFWHSLEHMEDPLKALLAAYEWLKDDGVLVVDVPNISGYDARHFGSDWAHWDVPFHRYHFTARALYLILSSSGFRVVRKKTYLSKYVKGYLTQRKVPAVVARFMARFFTGSSIAVVCRKEIAK